MNGIEVLNYVLKKKPVTGTKADYLEEIKDISRQLRPDGVYDCYIGEKPQLEQFLKPYYANKIIIGILHCTEVKFRRSLLLEGYIMVVERLQHRRLYKR